jgi:hypothetical protein
MLLGNLKKNFKIATIFMIIVSVISIINKLIVQVPIVGLVIFGIIEMLLGILYIALLFTLVGKLDGMDHPEADSLRKHAIASTILLVLYTGVIVDFLKIFGIVFVIHMIYVLYKINKI